MTNSFIPPAACPWCGGPVAPTRGPGHPRTFCDRVCAHTSREYYRNLPGWLAELAALKAEAKRRYHRAFIVSDIAMLETSIAAKGKRP